MPESKRHLKRRTFLYQVLAHGFAQEASIGCDQFVYWNARDPRRCLAPDAFVFLGVPDTDFGSWKTWERGTPQLAVEIVSDSDRADDIWQAKLESYHELGVQELVQFDVEAEAGSRLRAWDRVDDDLVERRVTQDTTPCIALGLHWVVASAEGLDVALRLARDEAGQELLLSPTEAAQHRAEAAQRRIAELEAQLSKRGG